MPHRMLHGWFFFFRVLLGRRRRLKVPMSLFFEACNTVAASQLADCEYLMLITPYVRGHYVCNDWDWPQDTMPTQRTSTSQTYLA